MSLAWCAQKINHLSKAVGLANTPVTIYRYPLTSVLIWMSFFQAGIVGPTETITAMLQRRGHTLSYTYFTFLSYRGTFSSLLYHAKEKPPWFSCCPAHKDRASKSTGNRCAYYPTSSWAAPHSCSTPAEWNNTWWTHFTHPRVWQKHRGILPQTCFRYITGVKLHQFILDYRKGNGKFEIFMPWSDTLLKILFCLCLKVQSH